MFAFFVNRDDFKGSKKKMIGIDTIVILTYIMFVLLVWWLDSELVKLGKIIKQKDGEIKQLKRAMRDSD